VGMHQRPSIFRRHQQGFSRRLPLRALLLRLGQLHELRRYIYLGLPSGEQVRAGLRELT